MGMDCLNMLLGDACYFNLLYNYQEEKRKEPIIRGIELYSLEQINNDRRSRKIAYVGS